MKFKKLMACFTGVVVLTTFSLRADAALTWRGDLEFTEDSQLGVQIGSKTTYISRADLNRSLSYTTISLKLPEGSKKADVSFDTSRMTLKLRNPNQPVFNIGAASSVPTITNLLATANSEVRNKTTPALICRGSESFKSIDLRQPMSAPAGSTVYTLDISNSWRLHLDSSRTADKYLDLSAEDAKYAFKLDLLSSVTLRPSKDLKGGVIKTADGLWYMGDSIDISAAASKGYVFRQWKIVSGDVKITDKNNPRTTATAGRKDSVITAVFEKKDSPKTELNTNDKTDPSKKQPGKASENTPKTPTNTKSGSADTGDSSDYLLYLIAAIASLCGIGLFFKKAYR